MIETFGDFIHDAEALFENDCELDNNDNDVTRICKFMDILMWYSYIL